MSDKPDSAGSEVQLSQVFKARGADTKLGLVFGVGMVCKVKNNAGVFEPFVDSQDDHITDEEMLVSVVKFMRGSRALKAMHEGQEIGEVLLAWPLTEDLAKRYEIETKQTMWMVAVQPSDPADVARFAAGDES
jgi:hypothetical protein